MKGTPIALVTVLVLMLVSGLPAFAQNKAKARRLFNVGVAALEEHNYKEALDAFKGAYDASPHWKVLAHIGTCYAKLNRPVDAIRAFELFLEEGGPNIESEERESAQTLLDEQRTKVGRLVLLVEPPGTEVKIDGESVGKAPFDPILLMVGPHHVMAIREDEIDELDVNVYSGSDLTVRMNPKTKLGATGAIVAAPPKTDTPPPSAPAETKPEPAKSAAEPAPLEDSYPKKESASLLSISSNVVGAEASLDGVALGQLPVEKEVRPGMHRLEVASQGFLPYGEMIEVKNNTLNQVDVSLLDENEIPSPVTPAFVAAVSIAGIGLLGGGTAWGTYVYFRKSEKNFADKLNEEIFDKFSWQDTCNSGEANLSDKTQVDGGEPALYFCETESQRRDYAKFRDLSLIFGITGSAVFISSGILAAVFYSNPRWFADDSTASITVSPVAGAEQTGVVLTGRF